MLPSIHPSDHPSRLAPEVRRESDPADGGLHPAWRRFICLCRELKHGEIERLTIQDGVPVLAEIVKKKTKFT